HIISFFNEADKNPTFRDSFLETIEEAASTCGDRVSLSLIYVGVRHRLTEIDHRNLNVLAEFLKGVYALDLLRQITYEKHERQEDEVENYLIYPVKLKAILDLPIIIDDMQFNNASATEQDLQDAAARVIESVNNPATFHAWLIEGECFLIGSHIWENALKEQYKAEIDVINGKRYELLEEDNGVQKANDYYRDEMLKLTRQALA
ncbi:MAG: hypothetical protein KDK76_02915, partial [Chlamydiia bacterium]|nr:hypothetical protein [Chlamydiia bacterium]